MARGSRLGRKTMTEHRHISDTICVRINDAAQMIGVGRTKLYELIATGEVETVKFGKSTRVVTASLHDLIRRRRSAK
ncbi:MAG: helix-turn-helix domain-containing protein [Sphingomonadaceae bacterium]